MSAADPAGLNSRPISRVLASVSIASLLSMHAIETEAQVLDLPRFRTVQVLDEPVIDLEDPFPDDPRYNTIAVADVDGDDISDLVAVNHLDGLVNVYLGVGDGTFEDSDPIEAGEVIFPVAVIVADVTGPFDQNSGAPDGNPDLFVVDEDGTIALMIGTGDGRFDEPDQEVEFVQEFADFITGAVSADFDGDGTPDVAIADGDEIIFVCNDAGTLVPCPTELVLLPDGTAISDLGTGDFDGDGFPDVVVVDPEIGNAYAIWGDGTGNFTHDGIPIALPSEGDPTDARLAVANFDNAGPADFVVINDSFFGTNGRTFLGFGDRNFRSAPLEAPEGSDSLIAGDFNGDGVEDLVGAVNFGAWYIVGDGTGDFSANQGAIVVSEAASPRALSNAQVLAAADLNGDGLLDLVGLVDGGFAIDISLNVGADPTPTAAPTDPAGSPTPTPTDSQATETPTATATEEPTAAPPTDPPPSPSPTNSPTPRPASSDDDACAIVAPGASTAGWPLALGCVFILAVRRHRWRLRR